MTTETLPKPRMPEGVKLSPSDLAAKRYGTYEMAQVWGAENTFEYSFRSQAHAVKTLSRLFPDIVPEHRAKEIDEKAHIATKDKPDGINPDRIREIEKKTGHDVIAMNLSLEEKVSDESKPHVNQIRASADTTQTAKALQLKRSLEIMADSVENLRDILIEKSLKFIDVPHMDCTHGYDAAPTVAGRAFAHYAELMQSGLKVLKFFYENSIIGKWGDATGNHHSAKAAGIDGIKLQEEYCKHLGIGYTIASAQVPGREFEFDIWCLLTRLGMTASNTAKYVKWGRSDDVNIFINENPNRKKGSSSMPHKDAKNGNPTVEEQTKSLGRYIIGPLVTGAINIDMDYARDLDDSANSRINFDNALKFMDHCIRNLAEQVYWIGLREKRCIERVQRSYGVVTAEQVITYLTDHRKVKNPMPRSVAHDLIGKLATEAWEGERQFFKVLLDNHEVTSRIEPQILSQLTDPLIYIGQSKEIIKAVAEAYHNKKTFKAEV